MRRVTCVGGFENSVRIGTDAIGHEHFFHHAQRKNGSARCKVGGVEAIGTGVPELRHHLRVVQDGARNQVWKIRDKQAVMHQSVFPDALSPSVHQKSNLRERKK